MSISQVKFLPGVAILPGVANSNLNMMFQGLFHTDDRLVILTVVVCYAQ